MSQPANLVLRFVSGIFTGAFSVVLKTGLNIVIVPVLLSTLGPEPYSLYVLLINLLELAILLDLGFSEGLVKLLGEFRGKGEDGKANELIQYAKQLYLVMAVMVQLLAIGLKPLFISQFHLTGPMVEIANLGLTFIFCEISINLLLCFCRSLLASHSLQAWNNLTDSMYHIVGNGLGLLLLLYTPWGIPAFLAARLFAAGLRLVVMLLQVIKVESALLNTGWGLKWQPLRRLFSMSSHAMLINWCIYISHGVDQFVIGKFLLLVMVGQFEIVFRFLAIVSQLGSKICEGLMPLFARFTHQADAADTTRRLFLKMSFVNNAVTCFLLLVICLNFPALFLALSSGKLVLSESLPVLYVAIGIFWSGALQLPASYYLYSSGHHRFLSLSSMITALSNLALSVLLVKSYGIVGVALGTLIPQIIQHQFFLIPRVRREMSIGFAEYMKTVHLPVILPLLLTAGWILLLQHWAGPLPSNVAMSHALLSTGASLLVGGLIAAITWVGFTAEPVEREWIHKLLSNPKQIKDLLQSQPGRNMPPIERDVIQLNET